VALHECTILSSEATFNVPREKYRETEWLSAPVIGDASETALVKFFQPIEDIEETRRRFVYAKIADG
jgi:sodium/potassium-transporting ATPase subunit alpha